MGLVPSKCLVWQLLAAALVAQEVVQWSQRRRWISKRSWARPVEVARPDFDDMERLLFGHAKHRDDTHKVAIGARH